MLFPFNVTFLTYQNEVIFSLLFPKLSSSCLKAHSCLFLAHLPNSTWVSTFSTSWAVSRFLLQFPLSLAPPLPQRPLSQCSPSPRDPANVSWLRDEQQYDSFYFSSWILPPAQEKKEAASSLREERTGDAFWEVWERVSEGCLLPGCAACGGYHSASTPTPPSGPPEAPAAL